MRSQEIRLSFRNLKVRFRVYEPDDGQVDHRALFVSSPLNDADSWEKLASMLTQSGCLCVAAELPGFGRSPCGKAVNQDNDTRAQILWGILDEIEARRGESRCAWHLIGHGSAAGAIMTMALYQAESVSSRVLVCPVIDRFTIAPLHRLLASRLGERLVGHWYRVNLVDRTRFLKLMRRVYGTRLSRPRAQALYHSYNRRGMLSTLCRLMREGYALPGDVYAVDTPLMLIWGAEDRIFGGEIPSRLRKRLPAAEYHLVRCAHMPMETDPEILRDYLRGWFRFAEGRETTVVRPTTRTHADR